MNKTVLSYIIDGVAIAVMSFILAYGVSSFYLSRGVPPIIIGVSLSVAVTTFYILISKNKRKKYSVKRAEEKDFSAFLYALRFLPRDEVLQAIENAVRGENERLFLDFKFSKTTADEVLFAYQKMPKDKKLLYLSIEFEDGAEELLKPISNNVRLISGKELYVILKGKGASLRADTPKAETRLKKIETLLKNTFKKKRATGFAVYGISLFVLSNFVFYPLWYIVSGSLFLVYALTVKFFASDD